jgi:hypothetical protein
VGLFFLRRPAAVSWQFIVTCILILTFAFLICGHPISDWDARSIWFFHAKRIFIDNNLYAQFDHYVGISHNDYPVLVPAIAASIAKVVGHWNEIFPRLAILPVIAAPFYIIAAIISEKIIFNMLNAMILLVTGVWLLNGYMDAIVGIYCGMACILLTRIYAFDVSATAKNNFGRDFLSLILILASIMWLKNEGLLIALIAFLILLPKIYRRFYLCLLSSFPFMLFYGLWKIPMRINQIHGDLFIGDILQRGLDRLGRRDEIAKIAGAVFEESKFYIIAFFILILWSFRKGFFFRLLPAMTLITLYTAGVIAIYFITPYDLSWHLETSAERVFLVPNLSVTFIFSYFLYLLLIQSSNLKEN